MASRSTTGPSCAGSGRWPIPPAWTDCLDLPRPGRPPAGDRTRRARAQAVPLSRPLARGPRRRQVRAPDRRSPGVLPRIRTRCDADLARPGLAREKVLAAVVRLLELTLIRVGNDEYARLNRSFGLTTLRESPRQGRRDRDPVPVPRQVRAACTRSAFATAGWRRSSGAARTCPARSSSSTSATMAMSARRRVGRRQRLPARDLRCRRHGQGLPDVGRHGPRLPRAACARPGDDERAARTQRRRGGQVDGRRAREHPGRGATELRAPRDPGGLSRREDRRRAPRSGRGAARPAIRPRSGRRAGGGVAAPGRGCEPHGRKAPDRRSSRSPACSDPGEGDDGLDPRVATSGGTTMCMNCGCGAS